MMHMMELVGSNPGTGCYNTNYLDDIGRSTLSFVSDEWVWDVDKETVGGSDCGEVHIEDGHDPGIIPMPFGEFKMYYRLGSEVIVAYGDGTSWEDASPVEFLWDGDSTGPTSDCVGNVTTLIHDGGTIHEGMFFTLMDSDQPNCTTGFDDSDGSTQDDRRIVFAEHTN